MPNTPNAGAPLWAAAQSTPWTQHNKALRIFDAFAAVSIIEDRDLSAPPGACNDGARYLIKAAGSGAWIGHDGELAIAVGANAVNGWYFVTVAVEGMELWIRDENAKIRHNGAAWIAVTDAITRLQDLGDVSVVGLVDGYVLKWDASNGVFYPAPDVTGVSGASRLQDLTDVDLTGLVDGLVMKWDASNGMFYFASETGGGGGIAGVRTEDEGVLVEAAATILNFVGGGVTATTAGGKTIVTVPSGAAGVTRLQDLNDVSLSGMVDGNVLKWDASNGVFYPAEERPLTQPGALELLGELSADGTTTTFTFQNIPADYRSLEFELYFTQSIQVSLRLNNDNTGVDGTSGKYQTQFSGNANGSLALQQLLKNQAPMFFSANGPISTRGFCLNYNVPTFKQVKMVSSFGSVGSGTVGDQTLTVTWNNVAIVNRLDFIASSAPSTGFIRVYGRR